MSQRFLLLAVAAAVGVLALSSSASASTMSESGTTITWTGDSASFTQVEFNENNPEELEIRLDNDFVVYDDAGNTTSVITTDCDDVDSTPTESPADEVLCTDVDVIRANGGSGEDDLDAEGCETFVCGVGLDTILADFEGGLGEDELWGGDATAWCRGWRHP